MYRLKIARLHDSFFCKETRLHLYFYNPTGEVPVLSDAIKRAIASGKIIDVTPQAPKTAPADNKVKVVEPVKAEVGEELKTNEAADEGIALESLSKEELISFIKENELKVEFNSKTSASKLRELIEAALVKEAK